MPGEVARIWPRKNTPDQVALRQELLVQAGKVAPEDRCIFTFPAGAEAYAHAQECLTGVAAIPVGVVGPMPVEMGAYELDPATGNLVERHRRQEHLFVPLAHSEGGLTASVYRGMLAAAAGGGVRTWVLEDRITRDTCFVMPDTAAALALARWAEENAPAMAAWLSDPANPLAQEVVGGVRRLSRHAVLREVRTHVVGSYCHLLYRFTTGEACGPNMITRNAYALSRWFVMERFPAATGISPLRWFLETNMGGDKKPSHLYYQGGGHGKTVLAEAHLPEAALRRVLRIDAADLMALEHAGLHGTHASGMQSFAFTPASAVAALFAATGQDLGMVGTSSMAHAALVPAPEGGVRVSIRFSGLEVGTVGGGTGLPTARAYLRMLGCVGPGSALRLAQIVAATALCLEVSAAAAMVTDGSANFYTAHLERGGIRG